MLPGQRVLPTSYDTHGQALTDQVLHQKQPIQVVNIAQSNCQTF